MKKPAVVLLLLGMCCGHAAADADEAVLTVRLGKRGDGAAISWKRDDTRLSAGEGERVRTGVEGLRMTLGVGEATLLADFDAARKTAGQRFTDADGNGDAALDRAEATRSTYSPLRALFDAADRDGDGRVARREWDDWLDVLAGLTAGQVVLAVVDQGKGLFELLDADRDGRLSVRELRGAWGRLKRAGVLEGETLRAERLPQHLLAAVAVGPARQPPPLARRSGPEWFRAADRNNDGDVSRREFVGSDEDFRRADRDGDGSLDAAEAGRIEPKKR